MNSKMGEEEKPKQQQHQNSTESFTAMKSSLRQAIEVISSLISLSHSIRVFTVKWQLIRKKLEELSSGLMAIENCDSSENTAVFSGLIPSILVTVNECYDLARRCVDLSYSGKLLMQSDLDVLVAKFDRHVKNLSEIYTAGILTQGFAIVVSRPGPGACKDDMRFYIRDLLTRMKIGDIEMKRQALVNLHDVVGEDERYVKLVVEVGDVVNVLVGFLDSPEMEIQEEASKIVSLLSGFDLYKCVLVGAGIIGPLIRVLESGGDVGKEGAARCLQKLTVNSDNAWSVSAHGGVTALLKICSTGDCGGELIGPACGVLRNLVGVEEIKRFMVEEGAISTFIKLARSREETVQINSIEFLQNMASGDESVRQTVVKEGGVRALVRVLDPKSATSSKTREVALRAIENLCFCSQNYINMLMIFGFIDQLYFFLRNGEVSVQELALKVTFRLCGTSDEAKKAMGDAGIMPELVKLLDAKSYEVREMATEALSSLVSLPKNRKRFVQDDRNIGFLLQLLDQEEGMPGNKKLLLSILMSLTSCNSGRRKIASSGYLKNVEKLAEAEVSDAKRLVRKLSTNRFRSMLSGFWHS
ncbi:PREDICTED: vacuolar protein 8 [Theobroma cacao]|uniref:Vacuolar protein 8 n=2 Tax=Theobroma cacao TaxID=3641 RepID=A0AB32V0P3_THECC|nr:PREDICTED: vacuolar protein 8 [Theobroma cacao]EOY28430.1 ARM repeat superfamily protein [Theobroma cacao]